MNTQKVYKIVAVVKGKFISSSCVIHQLEYALEYKVDEWTTPRFGKIFAFESLEMMKIWIGHSGFLSRFKMFEAEAAISSDQRKDVLYAPCVGGNWKHIPKFWRMQKTSNVREALPGLTIDVIEGTIFCDKLKLIKEIKL